MTATAKAKPRKAAPVVDKCASCPELRRLTAEKKRLTRRKARLEGQAATPPPPAFAAVQDVIGKLQTMSATENAKASWKQLLRMNFDGEAGHFRRDIAPIKVVQTLQEMRLANGDPDFAVFHSLAWMILADERWPVLFLERDKEMADFRAKLDAGADDRDLVDQYEDRLDFHLAQVMYAIGENEMADLYLADQEEFARRFEQGYRGIGKVGDPESIEARDHIRQRMAASRDRRRRRGTPGLDK